jgi:hypothetical protein
MGDLSAIVVNDESESEAYRDIIKVRERYNMDNATGDGYHTNGRIDETGDGARKPTPYKQPYPRLPRRIMGREAARILGRRGKIAATMQTTESRSLVNHISRARDQRR